MINRKLKTMVNLLLFFIWFAVACSLIVYVDRNFKMSYLDGLIYSLTGLLVNFYATVAIHELGHILFAKMFSLKPAFVNFGVFSIDYLNGNKVKFFSRISIDGGQSAFLPQKPVTKFKLRMVAFGGLFFTLLFGVACNLPMFFSFNPNVFCFLTIGSCSAFYLFTVNLLPLDKTSDGSVLLTNRDYNEVVAEVSNHQMAVLNNEMPDEPLIFKRSQEPLAVYHHFMHLVIQNRKDEASRVITTLQPYFYALTDDEYTCIFAEILFNECKTGRLSDEMKNRAELFFTEENNTPAFLRAHCAYRKVLGEIEWAQSLYRSYEKVVANAPLFVKTFESALEFSLPNKRYLDQ